MCGAEVNLKITNEYGRCIEVNFPKKLYRTVKTQTHLQVGQHPNERSSTRRQASAAKTCHTPTKLIKNLPGKKSIVHVNDIPAKRSSNKCGVCGVIYWGLKTNNLRKNLEN